MGLQSEAGICAVRQGGGAVAVTDEVKPVSRAVYGSLKQAIHNAVPGSAQIDERLTNLLAAKSDLDALTCAEEVGRGGGLTGGKIGTSLVGIAEREAGRVLPAATSLKSPALRFPIGAGAGLPTPLSDLFAKPSGSFEGHAAAVTWVEMDSVSRRAKG